MNAPALELEVIDEPDIARAALGGLRARALAALREPGSATSIAKELGEPRQKVNYHLRKLEECGLAVFVEERQRRGMTERVLVASADSYLISSDTLGDSAPIPTGQSELSTHYLLALCSRIINEVGAMAKGARRANKPLATLAIDSEIKFASPDDRAAFATELQATVLDLVSKYHDESAPKGRWHRLMVAAHPFVPDNPKGPERD